MGIVGGGASLDGNRCEKKLFWPNEATSQNQLIVGIWIKQIWDLRFLQAGMHTGLAKDLLTSVTTRFCFFFIFYVFSRTSAKAERDLSSLSGVSM